MADPFIGEIHMMPYTFAPYGWAWCNGQILPIQQNTALFSIMGNVFGGDGKTMFALPNLQARIPIGAGTGPNLTERNIGDHGGEATVTLTSAQVPAHTHSLMGRAGPPLTDTPVGNIPGTGSVKPYKSAPTTVAIGAGTLPSAGQGQAHTNMMPTMPMNYCIALQGLYPPRA